MREQGNRADHQPNLQQSFGQIQPVGTLLDCGDFLFLLFHLGLQFASFFLSLFQILLPLGLLLLVLGAQLLGCLLVGDLQG